MLERLVKAAKASAAVGETQEILNWAKARRFQGTAICWAWFFVGVGDVPFLTHVLFSKTLCWNHQQDMVACVVSML